MPNGEIYGFNSIIRLIGKKESDFFFKQELHKISYSQLMGLNPHRINNTLPVATLCNENAIPIQKLAQ